MSGRLTVDGALSEVRSKRDREWIRYEGKDYLAEHEAKKIIEAARHLADVIELDGTFIGKKI